MGEGKTGAPGGKPLRAEKRTNKLHPHMTPSLEIKPYATPALHLRDDLREQVCDRWARWYCTNNWHQTRVSMLLGNLLQASNRGAPKINVLRVA